MTIYPAIDLYESKAVRLMRGDYAQMTVYSDDPVSVAMSFEDAGATAVHLVDLEGARCGIPVNFETVKRITQATGLAVQVGGGIRTMSDIEKYLGIGASRVLLGTAAVSSDGFLRESLSRYGKAIAVSADIKDGFIAVKGWTELSDKDALSFCHAVEQSGVQTIICTDISKDGLLQGTNMTLYRTLRERLKIGLVASGGITTLQEIKALSSIGMDGAVLGKALYTGIIDLKEAIAMAVIDR